MNSFLGHPNKKGTVVFRPSSLTIKHKYHSNKATSDSLTTAWTADFLIRMNSVTKDSNSRRTSSTGTQGMTTDAAQKSWKGSRNKPSNSKRKTSIITPESKLSTSATVPKSKQWTKSSLKACPSTVSPSYPNTACPWCRLPTPDPSSIPSRTSWKAWRTQKWLTTSRIPRGAIRTSRTDPLK